MPTATAPAVTFVALTLNNTQRNAFDPLDDGEVASITPLERVPAGSGR